MQRTYETPADAHVAPVDLHLDLFVLVELGGRAAQGGRYEEHPKLAALQVVDSQPGPRKQAPQFVDAPELAHGVEAPVEDAVPGLKVSEQPVKRFGGRPRLRGQVPWLGLFELRPQAVQARRVLPDEQLEGEVAGVERAREGSELRLVDLQAHHLADAELHAVHAHRSVLFEVREHEEQGQVRWWLGDWGHLGLSRLGCR